MNLIEFLQKSIDGKLTLADQANYLESKNEITPKELASAVRFLKKQSISKLRLSGAIDVCGTGGSGLPRLNTSTISSLILSSRCGVKVAKHGNRASSGRFGSFDLIDAMGFTCSNNPEIIQNEFELNRIAFLYAPYFHPVMKHFAQVRREIGKPTFFNLLGPLLNPANPTKQIIGTNSKRNMQLLAETCRLLGKKKVFVVSGEDGLDEVTITGKTFITEITGNNMKNYKITPADFGIKAALLEEILVKNTAQNLEIAKNILENRCLTRHKDLVLVNVALALKLTDQTLNLKQAYEQALQALKNPNILQEIILNKRKEVNERKKKHPISHVQPSTRNFTKAISKKNLSLIAEIKRSSPSNGVIASTFSPAQIAKEYELHGVQAISVLADQKYFGGHIKHIKEAAKATKYTPILCKEFIIDEYQILEARKNGADAILLIASILTVDQIIKFQKLSSSMNMASICEIHNKEDLNKALKAKAKIIGINNRNLANFKIDIETTLNLIDAIPRDKIIISESGFNTKEDVKKINGKVSAILVGTAIMKGKPITEFMPKKIKICGVRNLKIAKLCDSLGIDYIGINFVPSSRRKVDFNKAILLCKTIKHSAKVGIFQNQNVEYINRLAKKLNLDFIQLSGDESISFMNRCCRPVLKTIRVSQSQDLLKVKKFSSVAAQIILDSGEPGKGKEIHIPLKNINYPYLLAGGMNQINIKKWLQQDKIIGVDIASGVETNNIIDPQKIININNQVHSC